MSTTSARRPTSSATGSRYSAAAVARQVSPSTAVARCTARDDGPNRCSRLGRVIGAPVGPADPAVDVVAAALPVARLDLAGQLDPVQPLHGLVAVHRQDGEPDRATVRGADRLALQAGGDQHVPAPGLV